MSFTRLRIPLLSLAAMLAACLPASPQEPIVVRPDPALPALVEDGRVDHAEYDVLLRRHVDAQGLVDYAAWKAQDRPALERYLKRLAAVQPGRLADDAERLAYWINAYNALTLHGMLAFYPTRSIKDHVSVVWGFDFWDDVRLVVDGRERSLNAIEHEVLRKLGEPRIHFAIVCASRGCPRLLNEAYTGTGIAPPPDEDGQAAPGQLERQAQVFFADPRQFRIDRVRGEVRISAILDWFGEDFGGSDRAKLDFARRYLASEEDRAFVARKDIELEYLDYDWSINEQPSK